MDTVQYGLNIACLMTAEPQTMEKLILFGIPTTIYYPLPLHPQKCFSYLNYKKGCLPVSEFYFRKNYEYSMNPFMTDYEIEYVVEALNKLLKNFEPLAIRGSQHRQPRHLGKAYKRH